MFYMGAKHCFSIINSRYQQTCLTAIFSSPEKLQCTKSHDIFCYRGYNIIPLTNCYLHIYACKCTVVEVLQDHLHSMYVMIAEKHIHIYKFEVSMYFSGDFYRSCAAIWEVWYQETSTRQEIWYLLYRREGSSGIWKPAQPSMSFVWWTATATLIQCFARSHAQRAWSLLLWYLPPAS